MNFYQKLLFDNNKFSGVIIFKNKVFLHVNPSSDYYKDFYNNYVKWCEENYKFRWCFHWQYFYFENELDATYFALLIK